MDHAKEAERLLDRANERDIELEARGQLLAEAQVHALLDIANAAWMRAR